MTSFQPQSATMRMLMQQQQPQTAQPKSKTLQLLLGGQSQSIARADAAPPKPQPSAVESAGRGALQGATAGFSDEASGAMAAALQKAFSNDPEKFGELYRRYRGEDRAANESAKSANPKAYLAGEVAGGVATAPALPAASTLGGAAAVGAAYGAAAGLGGSKADLTRGDIAGAAKDTAIGAAIGAGAGALGHGAAKGAGWVYNKLRGTSGAAKLAEKVAGGAEQPSQIGYKQSVSDFERRSTEREQAITDVLGEQFRFKAGQATGDPAAALADRTSEQMTATMRKAQEESVKQTRQYAKFLDMKIRGIAAKPEMLGRADVGEAVAGDVQRYTESLVANRSSVAAKMFGAVDEISGNDRIVPVSNTTKTIMEMIAEKRSPLAAGSSKAALRELEQLSNQLSKASSIGSPADARLTAGEFQRALSDWGKKAASSGDIFKDVERGEARGIAVRIFGALKTDLDATASSASKLGEAGTALANARDAYRAMSEEIDQAGTETVKRLLKISDTDAGDTITAKLVSPGTSPEQIGGVFRILNKANPETAQQLRAQMLEDLLSKAGKPSAAAQYSAELGIDKLQPGSALRLLSDAEPKMQAAFAGDARSKLALREIMEDLQRLSFGPGIKGSDTASKLGQVVDFASRNVPGGDAAKKVMEAVHKVAGSDADAAKLVSSPEGLDAFRDGLRLLLGKGKSNNRAANAIMATFTRLGVDMAQPQAQPYGASMEIE